MLSRFVIAFLPRSKHLLILWLQSPSAKILEPKKIKSVVVSTFLHLFALKWWDQMPWSQFFECWVLSQLVHSPLSPSSRGSLVPFHLLPLKWFHLHIWDCWYFSWKSWFQLMIHSAWHFTWCTLGFPGGADSKESAGNVEDMGSIPGLGRSSGGRHGNPLQYSCLENPRDGGAQWAAVCGVAQSRTRLKRLSSSSSGWFTSLYSRN